MMYPYMYQSWGGGFWGWLMMASMFAFGILVLVALILLIMWLVKQLKK